MLSIHLISLLKAKNNPQPQKHTSKIPKKDLFCTFEENCHVAKYCGTGVVTNHKKFARL